MEPMLRRGGRGRERLFEESDADAFCAAPSLSVAGTHGLPLTISANNARRTEMILPSWANPAHGLIEKGVLLLGALTGMSGRRP